MKSTKMLWAVAIIVGLLGLYLPIRGVIVTRSSRMQVSEVAGVPEGAIPKSVFLPADIKNYLSKPFPATLQKKFPGGWEDMLRQFFSYNVQVQMLLMSAGVTYLEYNGRHPKRIADLCEAPYAPADCKDLRNPFTGRPFLETARGVYGWVGYEGPANRGAIDKVAYLVFGIPDIEKETADYKEIKLPLPGGGIHSRDFLPQDRSIGDAALTARSVMDALGIALTAYRAFMGVPPKHFKELEGFFPIVGAMRNAYRGDHAKLERFVDLSGAPDEARALEEIDKQAAQTRGTPGDFFIFVTRNSSRVFVFAGDGRPVYIVANELRDKQYEQRMESRGMIRGKASPMKP